MRVGIVEHEPHLRDALAEGLPARGITVVGRAADAHGALRLVERRDPDVLLLDVRLPPTFTDEGVRAAESLRARHPAVGLLVLSSQAELNLVQRLLALGDDARAVGYLLKERVGNLDELAEAIRRIGAGEVVIDRHLIGRLMSRRGTGDALHVLSAPERRVLALVAEGRSNRGIARDLGCQVVAVEKHLSSITAKLGLTTLDELHRRRVNQRVLTALAYLRGPAAPSPEVPRPRRPSEA